MSAVLCGLFFLSIAGYLTGVLLEHKALRAGVEQLWYLSASRLEAGRIAGALQLVDKVLDAVYRDNGRVSYGKIAIVTLLLNGLYMAGAFTVVQNTVLQRQEPALQLLSVFVILSLAAPFAFLWECVSYSITASFVRKAVATGKLRFLLFDVLALTFGLSIVPAVVALGIAEWTDSLLWGSFALMISPLYPLAFGFLEQQGSLAWLMSVAGLSICLPTVLVCTSCALFCNRTTLRLCETGLARLSTPNAGSLLRSGSLGMFTLVTGVMTYFGIATIG
jgi:hypothetical protein